MPLGDDGVFIMRPPPPRNSASGQAPVSGELGTLPDGSGVRLAGGEELRQGDSLETGGSYGDVQFSGPASACPTTGVARVGAPSS